MQTNDERNFLHIFCLLSVFLLTFAATYIKTHIIMKRILFTIAALLPALIGIMAQSESVTIEWPAEGFQSPDGSFVVPLNTPLTFKAPGTTDWTWTFEGATPAEVQGKEVTVSYAEEGNYGVTLTDGSHTVSLSQSISAGGDHEVWNILPSEEPSLSIIALAWYGWYGGTNWIDMLQFAEYFHQPSQPATIDQVGIMFGSYEATSTNQDLTVSIAAVGSNGKPADVLATSTKKVGDIAQSTTQTTFFDFAEPVAVDGPFFVVIGPFPNASGDKVAMKCVRRAYGELCTVYHQLKGNGSIIGPGGGDVWYRNDDDPASFAIIPHLCYAGKPDAIATPDAPSLRFDGHRLLLPPATSRLQVFATDGTLLIDQHRPEAIVSLSALRPGVYIVKADQRSVKVCVGRHE